MRILLICLTASLLSAQCETACDYEGFPKGRYNEKTDECECIRPIPRKILLGKKFRLQKARDFEEND
jgi:hypothetical protein